MPESTLTSKGQTTIPRDIRRLLGLKKNDRILYEVADERSPSNRRLLCTNSTRSSNLAFVVKDRRPQRRKCVRRSNAISFGAGRKRASEGESATRHQRHCSFSHRRSSNTFAS